MPLSFGGKEKIIDPFPQSTSQFGQTWAMLLQFLFHVGAALALGVIVCRLFAKQRYRNRQQRRDSPLLIGFFHPACHTHGGGERVLWSIIQSLQTHLGQRVRIQVYCTAGVDTESLLDTAVQRFNLPPFQGSVELLPVRSVFLLDPKLYPRFTLLGQSLGSMLVAMECLLRHPLPDVWYDTAGHAFTFLIARLCFQVPEVQTYVHYPTISTDMFHRVREQRPSYNNDQRIAGNATVSRLKVCLAPQGSIMPEWLLNISPISSLSLLPLAQLLYYRIFALLYRICGGLATGVQVNSTWTYNHISELWGKEKVLVVFPPCNTSHLQELPLEGRKDIILSVAQFRPEKDHPLQIRAFARFQEKHPELAAGTELRLLGGVRDDGDQRRVEELRALAEDLGVKVDIRVNAPYTELRESLGEALIGLHTMWNEHFGIGVVEFMAAGLVTLAHNSGGPKEDLVKPFHRNLDARDEDAPATGILASTEEEYAEALAHLFGPFKHSGEMRAMREAARRRAQNFSDEAFDQRLQEVLIPQLEQLLQNQRPAASASSSLS